MHQRVAGVPCRVCASYKGVYLHLEVVLVLLLPLELQQLGYLLLVLGGDTRVLCLQLVELGFEEAPQLLAVGRLNLAGLVEQLELPVVHGGLAALEREPGAVTLYALE